MALSCKETNAARPLAKIRKHRTGLSRGTAFTSHPAQKIARAEQPAVRHPLRSDWHGKKLNAGIGFRHSAELLPQTSTSRKATRGGRSSRPIDSPDLIQKLAHAARALRAQQVPLAGMPSHHFAGGGDLEALGGAAVRLQLHFLVLLHDILCRAALRDCLLFSAPDRSAKFPRLPCGEPLTS